MKRTTLTIVMATLCLNFTGNAQHHNTNIKPLKIGDTIPEAVWNMPLQVVNHPEGKKTITLNDYKGKLIILDFWATWCGSCIAGMPKIAMLQGQFAKDMAVINVTKDLSPKALQCLTGNPMIKSLNSFSVASDNLLSRIFPHRTIPHYIWIDQAGRFVSQSDAGSMLPENIVKVLEGNSPDWQEKRDIDKTKPLFLGDDLPKDVMLKNFSIFIEGSVSGLSTSMGRSLRGAVQQDQFYTNSSLLHIYSLIGNKLLAGKGIKDPAQKRILVKIGAADSSAAAKQIYTFQYICSNKPDSLYPYALQALNMASGYHGRLNRQKVTNYQLVLKGNGNTFRSAGGKAEIILKSQVLQISNQPVSRLVERLNSMDCIPYFVTDHTGLKNSIDLKLEGPLTDFQTLRRQLITAGLDLLQVEDEQLVFLLSKSI